MDSHIDESNGEHKTDLALREITDKYESMQLHPHQTVKITEAVNNVPTYRDHSDRSIEEKYYNETKSTAVKECGTLLWTDEVCNKQQTINKQEDMCYTQPKCNRLNDVHSTSPITSCICLGLVFVALVVSLPRPSPNA